MNFDIEIIQEKQSLYNDNRLIRYTPIIPYEPIIIDDTWFQKQPENLKINLRNSFPNLILDDIELPHKEFKENEAYWKFISIYKQQYLFDNYEYLFDDCYIVNLSDDEKEEILGLCILYKQNPEILNNVKNRLSANLCEKIQIQLAKCNNNDIGIFVKTSIKSAKHHKTLTPCYTVSDILSNIIISPQVIQSLLVDNCNIIMRKWNSNISNNNEFRVFILDKKIKCISQQKLEFLNISIAPNIIINSICEMWNELTKKINYNDCVIDCYIYNNIAHVIEINSGGIWSTAGSALFNWEEIIKLQKPILRLMLC
jgi:hypothetical protein